MEGMCEDRCLDCLQRETLFCAGATEEFTTLRLSHNERLGTVDANVPLPQPSLLALDA